MILDIEILCDQRDLSISSLKCQVEWFDGWTWWWRWRRRWWRQRQPRWRQKKEMSNLITNIHNFMKIYCISRPNRHGIPKIICRKAVQPAGPTGPMISSSLKVKMCLEKCDHCCFWLFKAMTNWFDSFFGFVLHNAQTQSAGQTYSWHCCRYPSKRKTITL